MLEIKVIPGKDPQIIHQGDPIHLAAELASCASVIYQNFGEEDPFAAMIFKHSIQAAIEDGSPTWQPVEGVVTVKIDVEAMRNGQVQDPDGTGS